MGRRHSIVKLNSRFSRFQSHFRFPDFNFTSEFTSDGHLIRTSPEAKTVIGDSLVILVTGKKVIMIMWVGFG